MKQERAPKQDLSSSENKSKMWPDSAYSNMNNFALWQAREKAHSPADSEDSMGFSDDPVDSPQDNGSVEQEET